jgi:hypothetical protein
MTHDAQVEDRGLDLAGRGPGLKVVEAMLDKTELEEELVQEGLVYNCLCTYNWPPRYLHNWQKRGRFLIM